MRRAGNEKLGLISRNSNGSPTIAQVVVGGGIWGKAVVAWRNPLIKLRESMNKPLLLSTVRRDSGSSFWKVNVLGWR